MTAPLYRIPGASVHTADKVQSAESSQVTPPRTVADVLAQSQVESVMDDLDRELIGLVPVKSRIRDIAALLVIDKLRAAYGLNAQNPSLHMCFTGNPGTGKTTVALRMAEILHRLGYIRKGHLVAVTRDDLVGQYIGHTAPKTKEVLKKAMGGVLFIDEAYYLYRPENERDYGQEAIEILLQVMENQRDDLVVILAGYKDRMDTFFQSNPGMSSRIAHHLDFPDYDVGELLSIADKMLAQQQYQFGPGARLAFDDYLNRLSLGREWPVTALVVDLDKLKTTNDSFGHVAGDALICRAANLLQRDAYGTVEINSVGNMPAVKYILLQRIIGP